MELRVLSTTIPAVVEGSAEPLLPPIDSPIDYAAAGPLAHACGPLTTVRAVVCRNAAQDLTLAQKSATPEMLRGWWWSFNVPRVMGAEWRLRLRDLLYAGTR
jgi:hypothetical protein